jgi:hypothetical protein
MPTKKKVAAVTHTLIIFEQVPESTQLYLVPDSEIDEEHRKVLRTAHGNLVNTVDLELEEEDAINCISSILCKTEDHLAEAHPKGSRWAMHWAKYEKQVDEPLEGLSVSNVYWTGWVL